ncbi:MAG: hypothetical protein HC886_19830 [Leptolyngbyaceae cyanobacterium SM1_1_3]|nr:hypothetical protein [Leptolyngbyaceae cyanobacterium SM1_1_3]
MINVIGQRLSRTQIAVAVIALLVTLLIQWPAVANSLPPPTLTWLTFSYETNPAALEGLQLAQCNDDACQQPTLVAQHGKCTRSGCLSAAEPVQDFRCQGRTCLLAEEGMTGNSILAEGGSFKLIGQFADRVRQSPVAQVNTLGGFLRRNWRVTVSATELRVAEDSGLLTKQGSGLLYWGSFGLTLLLELAVASAYLKKLQANAAVVQRTLISLGLVQFVSYPVVWHFVEIASPFQFLSVRVFAFVCLGIAVLYGLLLLPARKAPERRRCSSLWRCGYFYLVLVL